MTSAEQAETRLAFEIGALWMRQHRQGLRTGELARRLNQPESVVRTALMSLTMSVATAAMLAHAMGHRLVPTPDGRSMEPQANEE